MALKSTRRIIYGAINFEWLEVGVKTYRVHDVVALHYIDFGELTPGQWVMPGLVSAHAHACQDPNLGGGWQYGLLDWLSNLTFPTEAKLVELNYALTTNTAVFQRVPNLSVNNHILLL